MTTTRDEVTLVLAEIMTKDLPKGVVEADRCAKLAKICLMHGIMNGRMGLDLVRRDGRDRLRDLERSHEQGEVLMKGIFTGCSSPP